MSEETANLLAKIEQQSRFTRATIIICTITTITVALFINTQTIQALPACITADFMLNMDKFFTQWKFLENTRGQNAAAPAPAAKK